jgi:phosphatidate cytidylyltransferase
MLKRIASAFVLVPAFLAFVIWAAPPYFLIGLGVIGTLCLYEYFGLVRAMGLRAQPWYGYATFWCLLAGFHLKWLPPVLLLSIVLMAGFLAAAGRRDALRDRALGLMANMTGTLYLALFLYPALPLRFEFGSRLGLHWLIILLAVIWVGDTAALFVGKSIGRTPLAPTISPKKTNEGALGGLAGGTLAAVLIQHFLFKDLPLNHVIFASLLLGVSGQLGDLAESMLKRAAQVKDSSHIIPGHGGVLDRIDSLLFALPVQYLYLLFLYRT